LKKFVSASRRKQQAGSLRSPEFSAETADATTLRLHVKRRFAGNGKVTTVLPFAERRRRNLRVLRSSIFRNPYSYELEKIHSPQLRDVMHSRGVACDGADERSQRFDASDVVDAVTCFYNANADATRADSKLQSRFSPFQRLPSR
jgi:hypothetical protein